MTTFQKIIKYLAIAFGIYLTITIFSVIIAVGTSILGVSTVVGNIGKDDEKISYTKEFSNINELEVDINVGNLVIKKGEMFKVEATDVNKNLTCEDKNGKLKIEQKSNNLIKNDYGKIIIYIPEGIVLNNVDIDTEVASSEIEYLISKKCEIDLGIGNTKISNANIQDKVEIDTGTGELKIDNSTLNNLSLSTGVGKTDITANITGNSKIESGVGELNIQLLGNKEDYQITTEKGIGQINLNNEKINEGTIGTGKNKIRIEGGIGTINIELISSEI